MILILSVTLYSLIFILIFLLPIYRLASSVSLVRLTMSSLRMGCRWLGSRAKIAVMRHEMLKCSLRAFLRNSTVISASYIAYIHDSCRKSELIISVKLSNTPLSVAKISLVPLAFNNSFRLLPTIASFVSVSFSSVRG